MRAVDLVARKRDGHALAAEELAWLVDGYLHEGVSEGQMAAFLMAGVLQGFTADEASALTRILVESGDVIDLSPVRERRPGPTLDKHSTGGVADATTLLVAPLVAACGATLVKLSGRGLGHTGGTLDKLEAIPGMRVGLEEAEILDIAARVGCVVAAQTDRLVPADRALYALRDVTATVPAVALIAASVMSKKIAAGAEAIVVDVKAGGGAFMPTVDEAVALAELCVRLGVGAGRRCTALVTAMDAPLGTAVGNALEVAEVVRLLSAAPSPESEPLTAVALALASEGLVLARGGGVPDGAVREELEGVWRSGAALEVLGRMVAAQGGDPAVCEDPAAVLPAAPVQRAVPAPHAGAITRIAARAVGESAARLGAGRAQKGDAVDPAVGVVLHVRVGDDVAAGEPLAVVHARTDADADEAAHGITAAVLLGEPGAGIPLAGPLLDVRR